MLAIVHDSADNGRSYFERNAIPFHCLVDPAHRVYDQFQVESAFLSLGQRPGLFIVDSEGIVRCAYIGWQQWEIPRVTQMLEVCRGIPGDAGTCRG